MTSSKETVAITGGGGFLGIAISRRLCELGFKVRALDVFPNGIPSRLQTLEQRFPDRMATVHSDITVKEGLKDILAGADYVVHLAAITNPRVCNSNLELAYKVNVDGLFNVLASTPKVKKLLFTSSILVYGEQSEIPIKETARTNCADNYGLLKLMGEQLCKIYNYSRGIPWAVVRLGYIFGAWQSYDYILSALILQALNENRIEVWDPRPIKDFIYVDDAVEALIGVLLSDKVLCEAVNVASGSGTTVLELANAISELLNVPVEDIGRRQQVPLRMVADITRVRTLTNWRPATEFKDGLERTIAWFKANRHP